ncbi:glucose-6-phosphate dehydrogenase [Candidatus Woesearchaeota archaeon]|jgi:glucose-6-phosphate 1-dehydrogenase|nr:glucose-6-phosphate dehydrogenase [Candidatus Woesearchaeota archaeon]MBT5271726.1 glucose-6-phosphate dehydrogenase [Candidatus Woesearchaeota archaeon]MBT6041085.1 glucose-6-phosphate dehydrogenase [Candidatus Woesearchaeota archaeon]MBT6337410.1 glucose-6-phosphate dehydrogenase [Candidatus Woesearchaeota archaeon]MBT7926930.1 glucose-6-phosphate dehydrogenase [Candidatus Woesearchaeota archaeon]
MEDKCLIVILGATGDLTKKKLIPAIHNLVANKKIKDFAVVGVGRAHSNPKLILKKSKKYVEKLNKKTWSTLEKRMYYFQADFYDNIGFCKLEEFTKSIEKKHKLPGNRIFYLATLPSHFKAIADNLSRCGLTKEKIRRKQGFKKNWTKVVFEKPFGHDLKSAKKINKCIKKVFKEKQIYRIDHYLGKELIQNIAVARFTNTILEPLWNKKHIDHIQIILSEDVGIEERGAFYDKYGAIRDVMQNHMMQMLSLATMDTPKKLTGNYIRDKKVKILKSIKPSKIKEETIVGQYIGYTKEKVINKTSSTETFAATKMFIKSRRWKNVPFYFITGKKMKNKITSIYIQFKEAPCLLFSNVCNFKPNYMVIQIQPEEGFYIQLNAKIPGKPDITSVKMDFCHECTFGPGSPVAYENLLNDVIIGDQSTFVRTDEIEQQWKIIDKIKNSINSTIKNKKTKLHKYKIGTYPKEADKLIEKDGREWHLKVK